MLLREFRVAGLPITSLKPVKEWEEGYSLYKATANNVTHMLLLRLVAHSEGFDDPEAEVDEEFRIEKNVRDSEWRHLWVGSEGEGYLYSPSPRILSEAFTLVEEALKESI